MTMAVYEGEEGRENKPVGYNCPKCTTDLGKLVEHKAGDDLFSLHLIWRRK